jgi:uncharacterized protein (TIGR00303 family)
MIRIYSSPPALGLAQTWLTRFRSQPPLFACVLGFTETGLIPGISAAGATPADRRYTALADAEFLIQGPQSAPKYPLPPLQAGASPVLITRAVTHAAKPIPVHLFNAGLSAIPSVPMIDLGGSPAACVSGAKAMPLETVQHLFQQGLVWGAKLAAQVPTGYVILSECVVGGTTTALAVLTGLGWEAAGRVNSSHPACNHQQKQAVVAVGLAQIAPNPHPFELVAAVGDPMQIVVAGMILAASRSCGVLLAGGTQMLAVYALAAAIATVERLDWQPAQVIVGTTRWVAEDPTGDTPGLAELISAPLLATQLSFAQSRYPALRVYEQGYVKEGVGAGGCAIAASLAYGWGQVELLQAIETIAEQLVQV